MTSPSYPSSRASHLIILMLTFMAFGLRIWRLEEVPPGWRDDELINSLVISQKVLDGDIGLYYPDASGHEALYHALNALMLSLFGPGIFGIRWLSVILGTVTVPITWQVGRRIFGPFAGLAAAAALSLSFWSLMYSRIGLRHVLIPPLIAAAVLFFWRGMRNSSDNDGPRFNHGQFLWAGLAAGLAFYTYFAARGLPLILLAFCAYLWFFDRTRLKKRLYGIALTFGTMFLLALPLLFTLGSQPESESRVAELAMPLVEAQSGNFGPLWDHIRITLSMFHGDGDGEWLYNIPQRPVFGPFGALLFWSGVAAACWHVLNGAVRENHDHHTSSRQWERERRSRLAQGSAFLLLWWLAGISPAFISVPPASLGHTIMAQPAVFILAALPIQWLSDRRRSSTSHPRSQQVRRILPWGLALLLLVSIGWRDLPDYFHEWPQRGLVRFLYRADIHEVAQFLSDNHEPVDFAISGLLAGPWDRIALEIGLGESAVSSFRPRWFNPERAIILQPTVSFAGFPKVDNAYANQYQPVPAVEPVGGYRLSQVAPTPMDGEMTCFENGLCWLDAVLDRDTGQLDLEWLVNRPLDLPEMPLISNPPPPAVYAGPRLMVFAQLQDEIGNFMVGDDGLWVDPQSLHPGDRFRQQHKLIPPMGTEAVAVVFGLYDPMTGERVPSENGADHIKLDIGE